MVVAQREILQKRRLEARQRAVIAHRRTAELKALMTPEEREAYRVAHLSPEERKREEELKAIEIARVAKEMHAKAKRESEREARLLVEEHEVCAQYLPASVVFTRNLKRDEMRLGKHVKV